MVTLVSSTHPRRSTAHSWPAHRSRGGEAALWTGGGILAVALVLLVLGALHEPGPGMLWLAVAAAVAALAGGAICLWGLAYRQLAYQLSQDELLVRWFGRTIAVPYAAIDGIYTGQRLVGHRGPRVPRWPGIYVGPGRLRGIGRVRFFATTPDPAALTLVTLEHGGVVVSARDPQQFRAALIERVQESGDSVDTRLSWRTEPASAPLWSTVLDGWWLASTGAAVLLLLAVLALLAFGFQPLPDVLPLHFDATGQIAELGPKSDLLRLPAIGLFALVLNCVLGIWARPYDRLLARVLWVGAAGVEAVLLMAVLRLLQLQ